MSQISMSVEGLTCDHCVKHITEEIQSLENVNKVTVNLVSGGISTVTVDANDPISDESLQEAVSEAGDYHIRSISH